MMMHPVIVLGADELAVVPSLSDDDVLGFRLVPMRVGGALEVDVEPVEGPCILKNGAIHETDARIRGWRDVTLFGIMGFALELPDGLFSKYHGAVIIQNNKCVGVVQSTHRDAWGYPIDLLLKARAPTHFGEQPLRLAPGFDEFFWKRATVDAWPFSLTHRKHVRYPGREVDLNTVVGVPSLLVTRDGATLETRLEPATARLPADIRCVDVGGVVIGPGGVVCAVRADAQLAPLPQVGSRVVQLNMTPMPSTDQIIATFRQEDTFVIVFDDEMILVPELRAPQCARHDAHELRPGVYWWGICDAETPADIVPVRATPTDLGEPEPPPKPPSPLIALDEAPSLIGDMLGEVWPVNETESLPPAVDSASEKEDDKDSYVESD